MGKYFGTDGVRGRANEGLTLEMSIKIGGMSNAGHQLSCSQGTL